MDLDSKQLVVAMAGEEKSELTFTRSTLVNDLS